MKCIKCGYKTNSESISAGYVTEIVVKCPNCGWTVVTTEMMDIVNDLTKYNIVIDLGNAVEKENMRMISKVSGYNILESKKLLTDGGIMLSEFAINIIDIIPQLDITNIKYHIEPEFPY